MLTKRATEALPRVRRAKRHDHRGSLWLLAGGAICWCYQCGAWRPSTPGRMKWHKTTGIDGPNPAMPKKRIDEAINE
jgi:hypothetical protein